MSGVFFSGQKSAISKWSSFTDQQNARTKDYDYDYDFCIILQWSSLLKAGGVSSISHENVGNH